LFTLAALGIIGITALFFGSQPSKNISQINDATSKNPASLPIPVTSQNTIPTASSANPIPRSENEKSNFQQPSEKVPQNPEKAKPSVSNSANTKAVEQIIESPKKLAEPIPKENLSDLPLISYNYPNQRISRFSTLKIVSNITARLNIDQVRFSWTNGPQFKLSPGRHLIEASAPGYKSASIRIFLKRDQVDTFKIELAPIQ
jgi:hypothetical protein